MKKFLINKTRFVALFLVATALGACGDAFFDVNKTPNNPIDVPPSILLPTITIGAGFANNNVLNRYASVQVNYLAGAGGTPANWDRYNLDPTDFNNQWNTELYGGILTTCEQLIKISQSTNAPAYSGIGKLMKAYGFSLVTDMWGDVPYSEALKGSEITKPRIDKQEDIYKGNSALGIQGLFDLVRSGLADLDKTGGLLPTASDDPIYKGNLANWRRMGNTLLLKFAMQISAREPQLATSVINEVLTKNLYIESNSQDCNVPFGSSTNSQMPIYTYNFISLFLNDMMMSTRMLTFMNSTKDPRLSRFYTSPSGSYVTIDNGFNGVLPLPQSNWSKYGTYVTGGNGVGPVRLITNFQRAFILAEAVVRLGVQGNANAYFQEGIRASMAAAGVSTAEVNAYFAANPTLTTLSGDKENQLKQILTQKWVAWVGNGVEAYNDWRRTGYPVIPNSLNAVGIDGTRPVRVLYPNDELLRNPNFESKVIQSNVRVWWDVD